MRQSRATGDDRGAAAVEFALVSVLLFTLLFGIIQYSYFFYQSQGATTTAREAARLAAVGVTDCTTFESAVQSRATANGTTIASPLENNVALDVTKEGGNSGSGPEAGDRAVVTVTWVPMEFGFPFVPFISGDQDATAETRVESSGALTGLTC